MSKSRGYKSDKRSYGSRPKRKPSGPKRTSVGGFILEQGVKKSDLNTGPVILRGLTAGDDSDKIAHALKRRSSLLSDLRGSGGYNTRFLAPSFARGKRSGALYNPGRAGRSNDHYYYFPVFEFTVIRDFDQDTSDRAETKVINRMDNYETIKRYFARAKIGSKASWSVRPPVSGDISGEWSIVQTHGSYRRKGLDKRKLRALIACSEDRMAGYAVITGIRGVWRSMRSIEHWQRTTARQVAETQERAARGEYIPRKRKQPRRSKRQ